MGQRMAIMRDGVLQQCDEPEKVYQHPANRFVASFIGSPPMNFVDATVSGGRIDAGEFSLALPAGHPAAAYDGKKVILGIRPEDIADAAISQKVAATESNTVAAYVDVMEPLGYEYVSYLTVGKTTLVATLDKDTKVQAGANAKFVIDTDRIHIFDADTEAAIR